jgi:hypothetical protein
MGSLVWSSADAIGNLLPCWVRVGSKVGLPQAPAFLFFVEAFTI